MDKLINKLINEKLGDTMDRSRDALLLEDDTYIHDEKDKEALEARYDKLNLNEPDRIVINDYIACINTMNSRAADVSYIAGVSDTVKILNSLGLLKEYKDDGIGYNRLIPSVFKLEYISNSKNYII